MIPTPHNNLPPRPYYPFPMVPQVPFYPQYTPLYYPTIIPQQELQNTPEPDLWVQEFEKKYSEDQLDKESIPQVVSRLKRMKELLDKMEISCEGSHSLNALLASSLKS